MLVCSLVFLLLQACARCVHGAVHQYWTMHKASQPGSGQVVLGFHGVLVRRLGSRGLVARAHTVYTVLRRTSSLRVATQ